MSLLLLFLFSSSSACTLYLAPSSLPGAGLGVFTGIDLKKKTGVERGHTVLIENLLIQELHLLNYVYASHNGDYAICVFGASMMFNHLDSPNLERTWEPGDIPDVQSIALRPYGVYKELQFGARRDILAGEELFSKYGGADWFDARGIPYDPSITAPVSRYTVEELQQVGHCISDIHIGSSRMTGAGKGVFASRNFRKGELISISPVFIAPKHTIMREGASSFLINYCITSQDSDVVVIPFGNAAMANHGGSDANMRFEWYDWKTGNSSNDAVAKMNVSELVASPSAPLYMGYYATVDVQRGDELTINYGPKWEHEWLRYLRVLEQWFDEYGYEDPTRAPQFREPIAAPNSFFPPSFEINCVGHDCGDMSRVYSNAKLNERLNMKRSQTLTPESIKISRREINEKSVRNADSSCRTESIFSVSTLLRYLGVE